MCKTRAMMTTVMLIVGLIGPAAIGQGDPNLMGWWKFDGDASDASGNGRDGTLVGDATFSPGLLGQALVLDGTGDYVNVVGYKGVLGANAFSVALWINTTGSGTMINWGTQAAAQRVDFRVDVGRLRMEHGNGNVQGNTVLNDGQWHHVALTVVAGATMTYPNVTVYVDGVDDSKPMIAGPAFDLVANADFTIGRRQTNSDRAFMGWLDDVRLYNRVLTAAEVQALAARPRAYNPNPPSGAEGVVFPLLSWQPRKTAIWHDVYLGTSPELGPGDLVAPHWRSATYIYPGLIPGMTYYWKVDEIEQDGTVYPGDVWSFTFASFQAWKPAPADGESATDPNLTLTWMPGLSGLYHEVYFGTDKAAVTDGAADTFKGRQDVMTYATGLLPPKTTYYWRVDEVNEAGGKIKGLVWTFTTLPAISIADPNLVGWWTFDEGQGTRTVDWSGHGHHGTLNGTPTWMDGYDGAALAFDGARSGDYIEVHDYPGVLGKRDRTVAAWIQTITTGDIMAWGMATANSQKWTFRVQDENGNRGTIRVECQGGRIVGWTDLRDGEWHHVAAILRSAGEPTILDVGLYVDGVQEAVSDSLSMAIDTVGGDRNVRIGDSHQNRPVTGLLDDVRIYDRALSEEELDAVMRIDPQRAWRPYPATGSIVDIRMATPLTWSAGDSATKHDVYLGTDAAAVADANQRRHDGDLPGADQRDQPCPRGRPSMGTEVLLASG